MDLHNELDRCKDFSCIFNLVKAAVEGTINRRRVGLSLGLTKLPTNIGAFHEIGSNFIIMNKTLLEHVAESGDRKLVNAYVFHVLLHEYLHSLGFVDEKDTRRLAYQISKQVFGKDHVATSIANHGIGFAIPEVTADQDDTEFAKNIDVIDYFESENLNYFG